MPRASLMGSRTIAADWWKADLRPGIDAGGLSLWVSGWFATAGDCGRQQWPRRRQHRCRSETHADSTQSGTEILAGSPQPTDIGPLRGPPADDPVATQAHVVERL